MNGKNVPAFPSTSCEGLTKREYIATQLAAGLAAAPYYNSNAFLLAQDAVAIADALLQQLGK